MGRCIIDWVDAFVSYVGHALQHVRLKQGNVRTSDAEDNRRVVVGGVNLSLVVPCSHRIGIVEDGSHINLVYATLEVVCSHIDYLMLRGIKSSHVDCVGPIILEGELLYTDVVNTEAGQSGIAVNSIVIRLEPPGQGDIGARKRCALVAPISGIGTGAVQDDNMCQVDGN